MAHREPTRLETLHAECESLTSRIAAFGLGFQLPKGAILELALIRLLVTKGICTEDAWELTKAEVSRDALAEALAQAPQIKARYEAEARKPQIATPPRLQSRH